MIDTESDSGYRKFLVGTLISSCYGSGLQYRIPPHVPAPHMILLFASKSAGTITINNNNDGQLKRMLSKFNKIKFPDSDRNTIITMIWP